MKDFTWIESKADCEAAAASLALTDNAAGDATCKHEDAVLSWGKGTATYDTAHATFGQQSFQAKWNIPIAFETGDGEACTGLDLGGVNGGAVVISRGTCAFYVKAINAQRAGADYAIIYNQAGLDDLRSMGCSSVACQEIASKITIPVLFIPYEAGNALKNSKATDSTLTIDLTCSGKATTTIEPPHANYSVHPRPNDASGSCFMRCCRSSALRRVPFHRGRLRGRQQHGRVRRQECRRMRDPV